MQSNTFSKGVPAYLGDIEFVSYPGQSQSAQLCSGDINPDFVNAVTQSHGHPDVVKVMLDNELLNLVNNEHFAFKWPAKYNHVQMLEILLDYQSQQEFSDLPDPSVLVCNNNRRNKNRGNVSVDRIFVYTRDNPPTIRTIQAGDRIVRLPIAARIFDFALKYGTPEAIVSLLCRIPFIINFHVDFHAEIIRRCVLERPEWAVAFFLQAGAFEYVTEPLKLGVLIGNLKLMEALLTNPKIDENDGHGAIRRAAALRRDKILELLLKDGRIDPTNNNHAALLKAVANDNLEGVRLLIQDRRIDAGYNDNKALKIAIQSECYDIVDLLTAHLNISEEDKSIMYLRYARQDNVDNCATQ